MKNVIRRALDNSAGIPNSAGTYDEGEQSALPGKLEHTLPSVFNTSELAFHTISAAVAELSRFLAVNGFADSVPEVNPRRASLWFGDSLEPVGWQAPPVWNAIAGDYACADGWIRLHTNYDHHRQAALAVLDCKGSREHVERAILQCNGDALETAIVEAGGCAARMRTMEDWCSHPQGQAVKAEPLIHWQCKETSEAVLNPGRNRIKAGMDVPGKPLSGLKVLDLTRVIAGPVATRFLAAFGADVLRIDPLHWEESNPTFEMSVGKHRAHLDLKTKNGIVKFEQLVSEADVLVHGYRPGAVAALGLTDEKKTALNPGLTEVALCAYGWSGPWAGRRGFDSLVQMSSGIAAHGKQVTGSDKPFSLPVQALDHGAGYLIAASVLRGLQELHTNGRATSARLSLARTAELLLANPLDKLQGELKGTNDADYQPVHEATDWGDVRRLEFPFTVDGCAPGWAVPAGELRIHPAEWRAA